MSGALTTSSTLSETHKSGFSGARFPQGFLGSFCLGRSRDGQRCHAVCFGTLIPVPLGVWRSIFCFEVLPKWCSHYKVLSNSSALCILLGPGMISYISKKVYNLLYFISLRSHVICSCQPTYFLITPCVFYPLLSHWLRGAEVGLPGYNK